MEDLPEAKPKPKGSKQNISKKTTSVKNVKRSQNFTSEEIAVIVRGLLHILEPLTDAINSKL